MIYLFIGNDEISKQKKFHLLKKELLNPQTESFNCEVLEGKDLNKAALRESFSRLPVSSKNRLLAIKDISKLKENLKDYLIGELKNLPGYLVIVLDNPIVLGERDSFINKISKISRTFIFKTPEKRDVFSLCRAIDRKQAEYALNILADLFRRGEKPEKIMGGLRYHFVKGSSHEDRVKKIGMLLEADLKIKTGRLRPEFAVESLVVKLCS